MIPCKIISIMYCKRTPEKISIEWWEYMMSLRDLLVRKVNIQGYTIWYFTLCLLKIVFLRKLGWHLMVQELIKPLVSKWFHFPDRIGEWKIGDRGESLWEQRRERTANLTHIWCRRWDSNPGHICGRRVLSKLCLQSVTPPPRTSFFICGDVCI